MGINAGGVRDRLFGSAVDAAPLKLAVLPLQDLSGEPGQAFFAAGVHDTLITDLARIRGLRVTARASARRYAETTKSIREIARELNVDAVLTGSVARAGDRVRVTAQLIDAATENHLWTEQYDRAVRDVLSLQSEIVSAIARQVQVQLTPDEQQRLARPRPVNPEAHEAYLRGMFLVNQANPDQVRKGLALLHDAVDKDPGHALPYAYLAAGYSTLGHAPAPPPDAFARARAAALRALEPRRDSGRRACRPRRAHSVRRTNLGLASGAAVVSTRDRVESGTASCPCTLRLVPGAVRSMGRSDRIDETSRRSGPSDTAVARMAELYGQQCRSIRRGCPRGGEIVGAESELPGRTRRARHGLYRQGHVQGSVAAFQRVESIRKEPEVGLGVAYARAGQPGDARTVAAALERANNPLGAAIVYGVLGERDLMFRLLEAAYEERDSNIPWIPERSQPQDAQRRSSFWRAPAPHEPSPVVSHEIENAALRMETVDRTRADRRRSRVNVQPSLSR